MPERRRAADRRASRCASWRSTRSRASAPIKVELALRQPDADAGDDRAKPASCSSPACRARASRPCCKTLEDLGWEVGRQSAAAAARPAARRAAAGRAPTAIAAARARHRRRAPATSIPTRSSRRIETLRERARATRSGTLFLDCAGAELERRYSETRRRHPLALDRPASDGIARERELLAPLARLGQPADRHHRHDRQRAGAAGPRDRSRDDGCGEPTLSVMSFGFARGLPRNADLVFDMRFLRNPHWVPGAAARHRARRRRRRLCRGRPGL